MALALFNSNPQKLGFAVLSRKLGLEARFAFPVSRKLNRGTGRLNPSFSGVPQSAPLHFGLKSMAGLREWSPMGDGKYCCIPVFILNAIALSPHLAAPHRAPKRSGLRNDGDPIAAGVARS